MVPRSRNPVACGGRSLVFRGCHHAHVDTEDSPHDATTGTETHWHDQSGTSQDGASLAYVLQTCT